MGISVKAFDELTVDELYDILRLRSEIFVVEQSCVYADMDGADKDAYHIFLREKGEIAAYLRVIDKGKRLDEVSIGRVVSRYRRRGHGRAIMQKGIEVARNAFGADKIKIGAQKQAVPFYSSVGFEAIPGSDYLEDGIPHIYMIYTQK